MLTHRSAPTSSFLIPHCEWRRRRDWRDFVNWQSARTASLRDQGQSNAHGVNTKESERIEITRDELPVFKIVGNTPASGRKQVPFGIGLLGDYFLEDERMIPVKVCL